MSWTVIILASRLQSAARFESNSCILLSFAGAFLNAACPTQLPCSLLFALLVLRLQALVSFFECWRRSAYIEEASTMRATDFGTFHHATSAVWKGCRVDFFPSTLVVRWGSHRHLILNNLSYHIEFNDIPLNLKVFWFHYIPLNSQFKWTKWNLIGFNKH